MLLALAGLVQIAAGASVLAAVLALATLLSYAAVYTPLKRTTRWAVVVGAVPGALPVVIGWAAARPVSAGAWSLFALVFVWQLPHFLALAWLYRDDFGRAGLRLAARSSTPPASGPRGISSSAAPSSCRSASPPPGWAMAGKPATRRAPALLGVGAAGDGRVPVRRPAVAATGRGSCSGPPWSICRWCGYCCWPTRS